MQTSINLFDKSNREILENIGEYLTCTYASYPFHSYKSALKACDPLSYGNSIINYFVFQRTNSGAMREVSNSSCNEVLSAHYFDYLCHLEESESYLLIYANKLQHSHILDSIHYHMKKFFGENAEKPEVVKLEYTDEKMISSVKALRETWGSFEWFNRYNSEEGKKELKKTLINMGYSKEIADEAVSTGNSKVPLVTAVTVGMPNFIMVKIPKQYSYSTLSIFTLGIGGKVGLMLDNTKPFDKAINEFEQGKHKMFSRTEMQRRWSTMSRVFKLLRGAKPVEVFPSYNETKIKSAGYDTINRKSLLLNRIHRNAPVNLGTETYDKIRDIMEITSHVRPKFISLLGTKSSAEYVVSYLKRYNASLGDIVNNMEETLGTRSKRTSKKEVK